MDTPPLAKQYPNPHANVDRGKVVGAGVTLIVLGGLQALVALALLGGAFRLGGSLGQIVGVITIIEASANIILGIFTLKNSYGAAVTGLVLAGIGLALSFLSFNIVGIAVRSAIVALVARGVGALKGINNRVAMPEQENPLTAYYHFFVPLLARVMAADRHLDRRERMKIVEICNSMNISAYEQQQLIQSAPRQVNTTEWFAQRYMATSNAMNLPNPAMKLVIAALSVAGADGILVAEEEKLIREIGKAVQMDEAEVEALIAQQAAKLDAISPDEARKLLAASDDTNPEVLKASYQRLVQELQPGNYSHLGGQLGQYVDQRRRVVEKAYAVLESSGAV